MNDTIELLPHIKLRFNLEHPTLEECYLYGYDCGLSEVPEDENPYRKDTVEYDQWSEGWWAAFYGEKPLFELDEIAEPELSEDQDPANDRTFHPRESLAVNNLLVKILKITGAIAATALVSYQVFDLVA